MKNIEVIKNEYALYEEKQTTIPDDNEDILGYINSAIKDLDEDRVDIIQAIKSNCRNKFFSRIYNLIMPGREELEYYDKDNAILNEELDMNLIYKYYFVTLGKELNEENFSEINKLFSFTAQNYDENLSYIEEKRYILEYEKLGIFYQNPAIEEESILSFQEFFKEQIAQISSLKPVEKVKY